MNDPATIVFLAFASIGLHGLCAAKAIGAIGEDWNKVRNWWALSIALTFSWTGLGGGLFLRTRSAESSLRCRGRGDSDLRIDSARRPSSRLVKWKEQTGELRLPETAAASFRCSIMAYAVEAYLKNGQLNSNE